MNTYKYILILIIQFFCMESYGIVRIDKGTQLINNIWLLPDKDNPKEFYYIPQYPKIAQKSDKSLELLFIKYKGLKEKEAGAIFHALFEFTLDPEELKKIEVKLKQKVPGAVIKGAVSFFSPSETNTASFSIISSVLDSNSGFGSKVISSGKMPVIPGSKVAIAANLSPDAASLFEYSLKQFTSDLSIEINATFPAYVEAYNAKVTASDSMVYECFKKYQFRSTIFTTTQIREIVDSLHKKNQITINVNNTGKAFGIDNDQEDKLLSMFTNQLITTMFNTETGWAKDPNKITLNDADLPPAKLNTGIMGKIFGGVDNLLLPQKIYSLKKERQVTIREIVFEITKNSVISIPVVATGNISLLKNLTDYDKYFHFLEGVNSAFESKEIIFAIPPLYMTAFGEIISSVKVELIDAKGEERNPIYFSQSNIMENLGKLSLKLFRLSDSTNNWEKYKYRTTWYIKEGYSPGLFSEKIETNWIETDVPWVELNPPFYKKDITLNILKDVAVNAKNLTVGFFTLGPNGNILILDKKKILKLEGTDDYISFQKNVWIKKGNKLAAQILFKDGDKDKEQVSMISKAVNDDNDELIQISLK